VSVSFKDPPDFSGFWSGTWQGMDSDNGAIAGTWEASISQAGAVVEAEFSFGGDIDCADGQMVGSADVITGKLTERRVYWTCVS
jgi:hypothetical protein